MLNASRWTLMFCVLIISAIAAGCQSATVSGCGPFVKNNLSPAGFVALAQADRNGLNNVTGNDAAGERMGCW